MISSPKAIFIYRAAVSGFFRDYLQNPVLPTRIVFTKIDLYLSNANYNAKSVNM